MLRRKFKPVVEEVVFGGQPGRFRIGSMAKVTQQDLLAMAERMKALESGLRDRLAIYRKKRAEALADTEDSYRFDTFNHTVEALERLADDFGLKEVK